MPSFSRSIELGRRQIDEDHLVGLLVGDVGDDLAHLDAGDAAHEVIEALEMLDVERRPHIDAGGGQLLDVLVALGVTAALGIGVRHLVDDEDLRLAGQRRIDVEFFERMAAIVERAARQDFEPLEQCRRLGAAMRLDQPHHNVDPGGLEPPGATRAWRRSCRPRAPRRGKPSACRVRPLGQRQQRVGVGPALGGVSRHQFLAGASASRARLSLSTLTRVSPMKPSIGPSVLAATSAATWSSGSARAAATRATCSAA